MRPLASARIRRFDPLIVLWLALGAILVLLVVNPLVRLLLLSLEQTGTGVLQNRAS